MIDSGGTFESCWACPCCSKEGVATYLELVGNLGTHAPGLDCLDVHLHIGQACRLAQDVNTLADREVCN